MIPKGWKAGCVEDFLVLQRGFDLTEKHAIAGTVPVISSSGFSYFHNEAKITAPGVVTGRKGKIGKVFLIEEDFWPHDTTLWVKDFRGNDPQYIQIFLQHLELARFDEASSVPTLNRNYVHKQNCTFPPLSEQKAIAGVLSEWDQVIEKTERLILAKEKRFAGLVSKLLCNPAFKRGYVRDFTTEVSVRNKGQKIGRVLSVTNHSGFALPEDQFERSVASSDLSNYKAVSRGQYAYNPSRINVGSIARLDNWNEGVLSPMYVVFSIDESKTNSDFFLHWLSSNEAKQRIRKSVQGSVRESVSFADLGSIPFPSPEISEQKRIAETLNLAQREIDLLKKLVEKQKLQKRGLMQKLLTGEWRVKGAKTYEQ